MMPMFKKSLFALGMLFAGSALAQATHYPLTIENCGVQVTFDKAPQRVVALGQNTAEIMLLLGLQDKMVASAFTSGETPTVTIE